MNHGQLFSAEVALIFLLLRSTRGPCSAAARALIQTLKNAELSREMAFCLVIVKPGLKQTFCSVSLITERYKETLLKNEQVKPRFSTTSRAEISIKIMTDPKI